MPHEALPLECFLEILRILSKEYDTDTMARLLRVNKTFCAVTLPFLYRDCFNWDMHGNRSHKWAADSMLQLARTLLRQVHPQDRIPGLVQAAYLSQDHPQLATESPIFKYGHFIRNFVLYEGFERDVPEIDPCYYDGPVTVDPDESVEKYAATHQLYSKYAAEGLLSDTLERQWSNLFPCAIRMDLDRKLLWTLCQDHLETIKELSIPLSDIERYVDHVHHFTSLSRVIFMTPIIFMMTPMPVYLAQESWDQYVKERTERDSRLIRAMVQFVRQHTSIHNNVLRSAKVPRYLPTPSRHCTADVLFEILALLPPLENPRSIDTSNWCALVARLPDTNLDYLESIDLTSLLDSDQVEMIFKLLSDHPPFLPRCRTLKHLAMDTLGPDMFQWAVLEKKQRDKGRQQESIMCQHPSSWRDGCYEDPVPLRSITLFNAEPLVLQVLRDIAFAFRDSLEELTVDDLETFERPELTDLETASQVVYGQDWDLPCLRTLTLKVHHFQLCFDLDALQRFRALESLCLQDSVVTYNHHDIWSWSPVHLPHLKKLKLSGSPALRFNLVSLHHSPRLEELHLGISVFDRTHNRFDCYIPSHEDLEREDSDDHELSGTPGTVSHGYQSIGRRPRWTWDWDLPKLSKLHLEAVFAYKFDFQWLQHLPNLQHIRLNITSSGEDVHVQFVGLKDLLKGKQKQQDEDGKHTISDQYISLPKLESIDLGGYWIFHNEVVETLCLVVSPNLRRLNLGSIDGGCALHEWIALSRKMPCIERLDLNKKMLLTCDRIRQLGLTPQDIWDDPKQKRTIVYKIDGTCYDLLDP
ncbi:hypothetical protein BGX34_007565 [Mortierella sp. NVP85]|nr:hypothetical protein BGX34_007565 [Mortierella sp. NVP85]